MIEENHRVPNAGSRIRLMSPDGQSMGTFNTLQEAATAAETLWPGVEQRGNDNGRDGWDLESVDG